MIHTLAHQRLSRFALAVAVLAVVFVLAVAGAVAHDSAVPPPPANPTSADQIQNVDQVKTAIKAYYGDTTSTTPDPVAGTTDLHFASPSSAYANELAGIEANAESYLDKESKLFSHRGNGHKPSGTPAIVLDVDDTTLNTYDYEIYSNFVYNPVTNADFVNAGAFPAVFGMPQLVQDAIADGYTIFFVTGRPVSQLTGTTANLLSAGYPAVPDSQLYLKDTSASWLQSCGGASCTTDQYKALTRQHITSLGYDVVADFGDQFSDLDGGFSGQTFKIPNPMYFLP